MFTLEDIRNIALQIEKNGEDTYRRAARSCPDEDTARLLTALADDEKRHRQWLRALPAGRPLSAEEREMEKMGRELLREMMASNPFVPDSDELAAGDFMDVLRRSRDFEEDTIVFYRFLLALLDDPEAVAGMEAIIAEEGRHQRQLETLLQQHHDNIAAGQSC